MLLNRLLDVDVLHWRAYEIKIEGRVQLEYVRDVLFRRLVGLSLDATLLDTITLRRHLLEDESEVILDADNLLQRELSVRGLA